MHRQFLALASSSPQEMHCPGLASIPGQDQERDDRGPLCDVELLAEDDSPLHDLTGSSDILIYPSPPEEVVASAGRLVPR
jgi:hypothetical protein